MFAANTPADGERLGVKLHMANLKPCKTCSGEVAKSARVCPHCGVRLRMGIFKRLFLGGVFFIVIIIIISVIASSGGNSIVNTISPIGGATMTKAEFDQLQTGMTYNEATKIIGGNGEVESESGKVGGSGLDIHTVMYQYKGSGSLGANANLMFQDEKLINKSQLGLK